MKSKTILLLLGLSITGCFGKAGKSVDQILHADLDANQALILSDATWPCPSASPTVYRVAEGGAANEVRANVGRDVHVRGLINNDVITVDFVEGVSHPTVLVNCGGEPLSQ